MDAAIDAVADDVKDAQQSASVAQVKEHLDVARAKTDESGEYLSIAQRITTWYLDLVDDDLYPDRATAVPRSAKSILDDFQGSANAFARIYGKSIEWDEPTAPGVNIAGGEPTARLIVAVLAQYLNVAFSRGTGTQI